MNSKLVSDIDNVTCSRLVSVDVDMSALSVAATLSSTQISLVVVCDILGKMVGVITKTDIVRSIGRCQGSVCSVTAGDIMTHDVISCRPNDRLLDVLSILYKRGFVHLPVVDENNKSLGVLNARDALKFLYADEKYEESLLRDYVMGIGYQ